ncbi:Amiloride-sensitive sodium channel subunit like protein [Argiope bruennichi]|uniref:Amiloride-sensitive sodium channel subunit like protein n=1 Tax=Argiope bruennichi TaxID=94029 RepID=A0A8T0G392_ARGBR|nr:Amiloride-sensitive sodium channel subunit like protein [Argiope bruennichi]
MGAAFADLGLKPCELRIWNIVWCCTIQTQLIFEAFLYCERDMDHHYIPETKQQSKQTWRVTYVYSLEFAIYARCYSYNLHIFSKEEPNKLDATHPDHMIKASMTQEREDTLYPWVDSQVFLSVHSPFVPDNPIQYGHALRSGYKYEIFLRFEEEHLLPYPYDTNCTDYDAVWKKNNKTGPRSQEMCREFCEQTHNMQCLGCEKYLTMFSYRWKYLCPKGMPYCDNEELKKSFELCKKNCQPNCMFKETRFTPYSNSKFYTVRDMIGVVLYIRDRDVTIVSHIPLYNEWELFSYIGGLMGCWLGISVWAFVGVSEKTFRKIIWWKPNLRRKFRRTFRIDMSSKTHSL